MLRTRLAVAIVVLPVLIVGIKIGGPLYAGGVALFLAAGVWELHRMMLSGGFSPALSLSLLLVVVLLADRLLPGALLLGPGISLCILLTMAYSLWKYSRGSRDSILNFALTLVGGLYPGWLGAHLLALRALPDGAWWVLTVLFCIFAADSGGYFVGSRFGRHKMAPGVSPKKSWEGYAGGLLFGLVFGGLFAALWSVAAPSVTWWHGSLLGVLIALVAPLGDFAVSSFKREFGVKDSSRLIPGHGGVMDRLDTILVAVVLGYYYVLWLV